MPDKCCCAVLAVLAVLADRGGLWLVIVVQQLSRPCTRCPHNPPPRSRLFNVARFKATGRAPPKKGQGKRSGGKK